MSDKIIWFEHQTKKKEIVNNPSSFVDQRLKKDIINMKNKLSDIPPKELYSARRRYDGYFVDGLLRGVIKMANLNTIFELSKHITIFGDICGGPGGFVDYLLCIDKRLNGYGLTLPDDKYTINSDRFVPTYGNVIDPAVRNKFVTGLDLVLADGGTDVQGKENLQEQIHLNLAIAQTILALNCLKVGGTLVIKFFDTHTLDSVCLLYILAKCFKKICIYKPDSSRAANSERYAICKVKQLDIKNELTLLEQNNFNTVKITQTFYNYLSKRNNDIATIQLSGLRRLLQFATNKSLVVTTPPFIQSWNLGTYIEQKKHKRVKHGNHHRNGNLN